MALLSLKLLHNNPIKLPSSSSAITYFYCSSSFYRTQFSVNSKISSWMKLQVKPIVINYSFSKFIHSQFIRNLHTSGHTSNFGRLLGVSFVIGSIGFSNQVAYAMDGQDVLVDDRDYSGGSLNIAKEFPLVWTFVRKLWLPTFFFFTLLMNWDHPIIFITKAVLFLFSTKPSPLSVYVFVERVCQKSMSEKPYLYVLKSLYANKVEVQDYTLFCLATVEVKDQKLTLVGILGGWWVLPLSPGALSVFTGSALY